MAIRVDGKGSSQVQINEQDIIKVEDYTQEKPSPSGDFFEAFNEAAGNVKNAIQDQKDLPSTARSTQEGEESFASEYEAFTQRPMSESLKGRPLDEVQGNKPEAQKRAADEINPEIKTTVQNTPTAAAGIAERALGGVAPDEAKPASPLVVSDEFYEDVEKVREVKEGEPTPAKQTEKGYTTLTSEYQGLLKGDEKVNLGKAIEKLPKNMTAVERFSESFPDEVEIPRDTVVNSVAPRAREIVENDVERRGVFSSPNAATVAFYDPIVPDFGLNPAEISLGVETLRSLHERGETPKFVNDLIEEGKITIEEFEVLPQNELMDKLNKIFEVNPLRVIFEKFPTTNPGDQAAFYLKIHEGRSIKLFPTMAKLANADYDGDAGRVTTKAKGTLKDATELIATTAYRSSLDEGFFPLPEYNQSLIKEIFPPSVYKYGKEEEKALKEGFERKSHVLLAKAISDIVLYSPSYKTRFERSKAIGKIWKEIYQIGRIHYGSGYVTGVSLHPFHTAYQTIESLPDAGDAEVRVKEMLSSCLAKRKPLNYAELKDSLNSNLEWEPGKNYEYRIAADFAKYARRAEGITFKEDGYAYMDEAGLSSLYDGLSDHLYSLYMSSISEYETSRQGQKAQLVDIVLTTRIPGEENLLARYGFDPLPEKDFVPDDNGDVVKDGVTGYYVSHKLHPRDFLIGKARPEYIRWASRSPEPRKDLVCWVAFMQVAYQRYRFFAEQVDSAASVVFENNAVKMGKRWGLKDPEKILFKDGSVADAVDTGTFSKVLVHLYGNMTLRDFLADWDAWSELSKGGLAKRKTADPKKDVTAKELIEPYLDTKISDTASWNEYYVKQDNEFKLGTKKAWRIDRILIDDPGRGYHLEAGPEYLNEVASVIFDHKSFASQKYCEEYLNATDKYWEWVKKIRSHIGTDFAKNWDAMKLLEDGVAGINYLAPEVYTVFGVSGTRDFVTSATGKAILAAKSVDELRNIDLILRVKHRVDRVQRAWDRYQQENLSENEKQRREDLLISELDSLASSGPVWKVLANELATNGRNWTEVTKLLKESDSNTVPSINGKGVKRWTHIDAKEFWIEKAESFDSIFNVLFSNEIRYEDKINILSDFTKVTTGVVLRQTELPYLLAKDRQTIFSDTRYRPRDGFSQDIEYLKESSKQFDRYVEGRNDAIEQLEELRAACENSDEKTNEAIQAKIDRLSRGESNARVPLQHLAEGMVTALRKFSKDSEKSQQQQVINGLFTALSLCKNGMVATDWKMISDSLLGQVCYDDIVKSPTFLLKILTTPGLSIEVYNQDGVFEEISKESLLAKYKESWVELLRDNPGLIMAMREHESNFIASGDGSAYLQATSSFKDFILGEESSFNLAMEIFSDTPGFFAIAAAMTNIKGVSPRNASSLYENSIKRTVQLIAAIAQDHLASGRSDISESVNKFIKFPENKPVTVKKEVWEQKQERVLTHAGWYAEDLINKLEAFDESSVRARLNELSSFSPVLLFPNKATLHTVEDVEQMFFGAKTAVSTGANGAMSREIGAAAAFLAEAPEACEAGPRQVSIWEIRQNPEKYLGLLTDIGRLTEIELINIDSIARTKPTLSVWDPADCTCQGACCSMHTPSDGSSDLGGKPVTPLATFAQLIRTDSTERLNLKFKKVGFGGLGETDRKGDSVSKVELIDYLKKATDIKKSVSEAFSKNGWAGAVDRMASILTDMISQMGYEVVVMKGDSILSSSDPIASGFANSQMKAIAHAMLRGEVVVNEDGSEEVVGVRFVSLRAAIMEVNSKVDVYSFKTAKEAIEAQRQVFAQAGTTSGDISTVLFNQLKRHSKRKVLQSMVRQEASDWGRNFSLLAKTALTLSQSSNYTPNYLAKRELKNALKAYKPPEPWYFAPKETESGEKSKGHFSNEWNRFKKDWRIQGFCDATSRSEFVEFKTMMGGPGSCFFLTGSIEENKFNEIFAECYRRGIALAMDPKYTDEYMSKRKAAARENVITVSNYGMDILPFFDMKLNGATDTSDQSLPPIGAKRVKPGEFVRLVETTSAEFLDLGDSNVAYLRSFSDRFKFYKNGEHRTALSDAFGFSDQLGLEFVSKEYKILSAAEAQNLFTRSDEATIDLGVVPTEENVKRFDGLLHRWQKRSGDYDEATGVLRRAYPGEIVGFVQLTAETKKGEVLVFYSPIIPYDAKEGKSSVEYYTVDEISLDRQTHEVVVKWHHEKEIGEGMFFKIFEGLHSANKMIAHLFMDEERLLFNGAPVDCFVHESSTKSRRTGTLMKDCMHTMICEARHSLDTGGGYNAAESPYFLGTNPDGKIFEGFTRAQLKEDIRYGRTTMEFWKAFFDALDEKDVYSFYSEKGTENFYEINEFLTKTLRRCFNVGINPGTLLASKIATNDAEFYPTDIYFRYDAILDNTEECQNGLMAWFNLMMPWICPPNSSAGDTGTYMFVPAKDGEHALTTLVPHKDMLGEVRYQWEYLFTSIPTFSRDTSALMRPSAQKSYSSPSSLQNKILSGYNPDIVELRALQDWSRTRLGDDPTAIRALVEDDSEEGKANQNKLKIQKEWTDNLELIEDKKYSWDPRTKTEEDEDSVPGSEVKGGSPKTEAGKKQGISDLFAKRQ